MKQKKKYHLKVKEGTGEYYVLSFLAEIGGGMLGSFFPPQYPEAQIWRELFDFDGRRALKREEKRRFSRMLSQLRKKGQITKRGSTKSAVWDVTKEGALTLVHIHSKTLPPKDKDLKIVLFDIPEKHRGERHRLRQILIANDFKLFQRSSWVGRRPFPEDEYRGMQKRGTDRYVHILTVKDEGTLKNLDWDNPS